MSAAQLKDLGNGKIAVQGELTFDSVAGVLQASRTILNGSKDLCVDLSEVTRSDSSGVALLLEWTREAASRQQQLVFEQLPEQMTAIAEISGLLPVLPLKS